MWAASAVSPAGCSGSARRSRWCIHASSLVLFKHAADRSQKKRTRARPSSWWIDHIDLLSNGVEMAKLKQPFDRRSMSWLHGGMVRIPVRVNDNGRIELRHGGALPNMRDGTIGSLEIPIHSITDKETIGRLRRNHVQQFLEPRSVVMFTVDGKQTPPKLERHLRKGETIGIDIPYIVPVEIGESPLRLRIRGGNRARLVPVSCWIPALKANAKSLNHAYRLISEHFEPKRISHTGNVFELGYIEKEGEWIPLEDHRTAIEAEYDVFRDNPSDT